MQSCGYCCDAIKVSRGKVKIELFHNCESNFYLYISPEPTFNGVTFSSFDGEVDQMTYFDTCLDPAEFGAIKKLYEGIKHLAECSMNPYDCRIDGIPLVYIEPWAGKCHNTLEIQCRDKDFFKCLFYYAGNSIVVDQNIHGILCFREIILDVVLHRGWGLLINPDVEFYKARKNIEYMDRHLYCDKARCMFDVPSLSLAHYALSRTPQERSLCPTSRKPQVPWFCYVTNYDMWYRARFYWLHGYFTFFTYYHRKYIYEKVLTSDD